MIKSKIYIKEYNKSKKNFKILKDNNFYDGLITKYEEPEWEFPKGQRNNDETKIDCGIREFEEETNILKQI